eukprot:scaffold8075_cov410-Pinguiococcus_pyrenoidosus.AAC.2
MLLGCVDVQLDGRRLRGGVLGDDDHDVGVRRELLDERLEGAVAHLHAVKGRVRVGLAAAELELLDDVAHLLEAMRVAIRPRRRVGDHEERGSLEQHDFVCVTDVAELLQVRLQQAHIGNQAIHDGRPRAVQRLIPDAGLEVLHGHVSRVLGDARLPLLKRGVAHVLLAHQVHLVHQAEDPRVRTVLLDGLQHAIEVAEVLVRVRRLDVEHVDEHLDAAEDLVALRVEVGLVEVLLAAAVPQVQHQIAQKAHIAMLHIQRGAETPRVVRQ